jgi:hypothetical protein
MIHCSSKLFLPLPSIIPKTMWEKLFIHPKKSRYLDQTRRIKRESKDKFVAHQNIIKRCVVATKTPLLIFLL